MLWSSKREMLCSDSAFPSPLSVSGLLGVWAVIASLTKVSRCLNRLCMLATGRFRGVGEGKVHWDGLPFLIHCEHGVCLSHFNFDCRQCVQLSCARFRLSKGCLLIDAKWPLPGSLEVAGRIVGSALNEEAIFTKINQFTYKCYSSHADSTYLTERACRRRVITCLLSFYHVIWLFPWSAHIVRSLQVLYQSHNIPEMIMDLVLLENL